MGSSTAGKGPGTIALAPAEAALGWQPGTFISAYKSNRGAANDLALEDSPVGPPLIDLLEKVAEVLKEKAVSERRRSSWAGGAVPLRFAEAVVGGPACRA